MSMMMKINDNINNDDDDVISFNVLRCGDDDKKVGL